MTAPLALDSLQRWMLAVITHPAGVAAGAATGEGRLAALDEAILPSLRQTAAERMAVYSSAYFARLLEVLRELFPCLRHAVGDELFDTFAVEYLQAHPPASYTLHRLADRFADFLETTRPADDGSLAFVVDLARLEHAIDQVFDGPGPETGSGVFGGAKSTILVDSTPPKTPDPLATAVATGQAPLALVPGLRLLAFRFPVSTYFTAWKAGRQPAWPAASEQFVALLRRDYIVRRHELSPVQFQLLGRLAAGQSLDDSLAALAAHASSIDDLARDVQQWFTHWSASGFFAGQAPP